MAAGQTVPQAPQFIGSVLVTVQVPPQFVLPSAGQGSTQVPPMQAGVARGQTVPQAPQFIGSVPLVSVHVPLQFVFPSAGHGS